MVNLILFLKLILNVCKWL